MQPRSRALLALALIILGGHPAGSAQAQDGSTTPAPVVQIIPSLVQLGSAPVRIEIQVSGAPPTEAFELELTYNGEAAVVTAVEAGGFLASPSGLAEIEVREARPGDLVVAGEIAMEADGAGQAAGGGTEGAGDTAGSGGEAAVAPGGLPTAVPLLPSGEGVLVYVTLAPLARTEGAGPITIAAATLRGADGTVVDAEAIEAQLTVVEDPPADAREQALAQAAVLTEQAEASGGLAGTADAIADAYNAAERRFWRLGSGMAPQIVWLGLLGLALAVVGVGWYFGRRPVNPIGG